jgi:peptidoglycan/LPS O-acetylase OafA/YrhL
MTQRISHLDGQRGLAILLVILYHAFARWPELLPYGAQFKDLPPAKYGYLGVQLFFLISGYVILMTLENCQAAGQFLRRRWLRLFPAMLVCSLIVFFSAGLLPERPAGPPHLSSLLPGLSFIDPLWLTWATGQPIKAIEGAYWTLFVEFKFYVFAALIHYWRGRTALLLALVAAYASTLLAPAASQDGAWAGSPAMATVSDLLYALSFEHFGWFAAGAALYIHARDRRAVWLLIALCCTLLSSLTSYGPDTGAVPAALLMALFFAISLDSRLAQQVLNTRPLQFLGGISYPLYLLHENMMVALIVKFGHHCPPPLQPWLIIPAGAIVCALAYAVATWAEPRLKRLLTGQTGGQHKAPA